MSSSADSAPPLGALLFLRQAALQRLQQAGADGVTISQLQSDAELNTMLQQTGCTLSWLLSFGMPGVIEISPNGMITLSCKPVESHSLERKAPMESQAATPAVSAEPIAQKPQFRRSGKGINYHFGFGGGNYRPYHHYQSNSFHNNAGKSSQLQSSSSSLENRALPSNLASTSDCKLTEENNTLPAAALNELQGALAQLCSSGRNETTAAVLELVHTGDRNASDFTKKIDPEIADLLVFSAGIRSVVKSVLQPLVHFHLLCCKAPQHLEGPPSNKSEYLSPLDAAAALRNLGPFCKSSHQEIKSQPHDRELKRYRSTSDQNSHELNLSPRSLYRGKRRRENQLTSQQVNLCQTIQAVSLIEEKDEKGLVRPLIDDSTAKRMFTAVLQNPKFSTN